jgi:hypothetical protein
MADRSASLVSHAPSHVDCLSTCTCRRTMCTYEYIHVHKTGTSASEWLFLGGESASNHALKDVSAFTLDIHATAFIIARTKSRPRPALLWPPRRRCCPLFLSILFKNIDQITRLPDPCHQNSSSTGDGVPVGIVDSLLPDHPHLVPASPSNRSRAYGPYSSIVILRIVSRDLCSRSKLAESPTLSLSLLSRRICREANGAQPLTSLTAREPRDSLVKRHTTQPQTIVAS